MKISEYIRMLERVKSLYGDVDFVDRDGNAMQFVTTEDHFGQPISREDAQKTEFFNPAYRRPHPPA